MKLIFVCALVLFIQLDVYTQIEKSDFEEGKCYAKCLTPALYDTITNYYYTLKEGVDSDEMKLKTLDILFLPEDHYWIKSINAEDRSLNWYMNRENITEKKLVIVKNWRKLDPELYDITEIVEYRKYGMGKVEWYEVICTAAVNDKLIEDIKLKLIEKGFLPSSTKHQDYPEIKVRDALLEFQKNKDLPWSNINLETLDFLEIPYLNYIKY